MINRSSIEIALNSHEIVKNICSPIFNLLDLTFFRYLRIFPDGSRIHLCSDPAWTNNFYTKQHYHIAWYDSVKLETPKNIETIWDEKAVSNDNAVGIDARNHFNIHHGISIVRPGNGYYEVFDFATDKQNIQINDIYLSYLNLFERFFFYFREKASNLIKEARKQPIKIPRLMNEWNTLSHSHQHKIDQFLKDTEIKHYTLSIFGEDIYLTPKETECIYWCVSGKSAEEIAMIVNSSKRTVEVHLDNVKQKLGLYKISQVIKIVSDSGLIDAFKLNLEK